jgi:hypothetical protein
MNSSKLCMTHEHHLGFQWNWTCKWHANEYFIKYECQLNKQNNYECNKFAKDFLVTQKQWLEQLKYVYSKSTYNKK